MHFIPHHNITLHHTTLHFTISINITHLSNTPLPNISQIQHKLNCVMMHTNIHGASPTLSIYLCFLRPVTVVHPGAFAQRTAHHHQDSLTTTIHQSNNPTIHLPIYQTTNTSYTHPFTHSLTHFK